MKRLLPAFLGIFLILFVGFLFFQRSHFASAATANHVVISEIQAAGSASTDDFIELYNPTDSEVDLKDYRLVKVTAEGTEDTGIVAFEDGDVIPAHGYFLWCNNNLSETLSCDSSTSGSIANNNSIGLRNGAINTGALVDAVTFGNVTNTLGEGTTLTVPDQNTSVERKANSASTTTSMAIGGADELNGNGEDTENNSADFTTKALPQSQNTESGTEAPGGATPTPTISPTLSPEPTNEPSVSPTASPTATPTLTSTPTPTTMPSVTPTNVPSVTPTTVPSVTPTAIPSVSPTSSPTASPTITPVVSVSPTPSTPTPSPRVIVHGPILTCTIVYKVHKFFHLVVLLPEIRCTRTSI